MRKLLASTLEGRIDQITDLGELEGFQDQLARDDNLTDALRGLINHRRALLQRQRNGG